MEHPPPETFRTERPRGRINSTAGAHAPNPFIRSARPQAERLANKFDGPIGNEKINLTLCFSGMIQGRMDYTTSLSDFRHDCVVMSDFEQSDSVVSDFGQFCCAISDILSGGRISRNGFRRTENETTYRKLQVPDATMLHQN